MAKKSDAQAPVPEGSPDDLFEITVSRVARFERSTFRPGNPEPYRVKRRVVDELGDAVATKVAVEPDPIVAVTQADRDHQAALPIDLG